VDFETEVIVLR